MIINVDFDDVVYPFTESMRYLVSDRFGKPLAALPDPTEWSTSEWGITREEYVDTMRLGVRHGDLYLESPMPDARESLRRLAEDHTIRIVTSCDLEDLHLNARMMEQKLGWLRTWNIHFHDFAGVTRGKLGYPADVVIDDKPDLSWVQLRALNIMYAQPWNDFSVDEAAGLFALDGGLSRLTWEHIPNTIDSWEVAG